MDKENDLTPWEREEGRRRKPKRGDSIPPRTSASCRVHSKPKTNGQDYLDMYIRTKEKERTEIYGETLKKRLKNISGTWRDIKKDLMIKEKELPKVPKGDIEGSEIGKKTEVRQKGKIVPGNMKKIDWNY